MTFLKPESIIANTVRRTFFGSVSDNHLPYAAHMCFRIATCQVDRDRYFAKTLTAASLEIASIFLPDLPNDEFNNPVDKLHPLREFRRNLLDEFDENPVETQKNLQVLIRKGGLVEVCNGIK